jgi:hypothetical protein
MANEAISHHVAFFLIEKEPLLAQSGSVLRDGKSTQG